MSKFAVFFFLIFASATASANLHLLTCFEKAQNPYDISDFLSFQIAQTGYTTFTATVRTGGYVTESATLSELSCQTSSEDSLALSCSNQQNPASSLQSIRSVPSQLFPWRSGESDSEAVLFTFHTDAQQSIQLEFSPSSCKVE
jgi:hypothetical protein